MKPDLIDAALLLQTATYAAALELGDHKESIEPDGLIIEVGWGVMLCLISAGIRGRAEGGTWQDHEAAVWRAFVVGSLPIAAWQAWQMARRHRAALKKRKGDGYDGTEEVAGWGRGEAEDGDRGCEGCAGVAGGSG